MVGTWRHQKHSSRENKKRRAWKEEKKQENIILLASSGIITKTLQNRKAVKNRKLLKQNSTENFTENVSGKEQKKNERTYHYHPTHNIYPFKTRWIPFIIPYC